MQLNHLITSDYFDWKDHLKYHGLLIIVGSLCFSIILGLGKESHHDEAFKTFIFVYLMSCVFTSILMIPYSLVMILLHRFLRIKFYITLLLHIIFTIILTPIDCIVMEVRIIVKILYHIIVAYYFYYNSYFHYNAINGNC